MNSYSLWILVLIAAGIPVITGIRCYQGQPTNGQSPQVVTCDASITMCSNYTGAGSVTTYGCAPANVVNGCVPTSNSNTCYCKTDLCNLMSHGKKIVLDFVALMMPIFVMFFIFY